MVLHPAVACVAPSRSPCSASKANAVLMGRLSMPTLIAQAALVNIALVVALMPFARRPRALGSEAA